jgi:hypothetical protein
VVEFGFRDVRAVLSHLDRRWMRIVYRELRSKSRCLPQALLGRCVKTGKNAADRALLLTVILADAINLDSHAGTTYAKLSRLQTFRFIASRLFRASQPHASSPPLPPCLAVFHSFVGTGRHVRPSSYVAGRLEGLRRPRTLKYRESEPARSVATTRLTRSIARSSRRPLLPELH